MWANGSLCSAALQRVVLYCKKIHCTHCTTHTCSNLISLQLAFNFREFLDGLHCCSQVNSRRTLALLNTHSQKSQPVCVFHYFLEPEEGRPLPKNWAKFTFLANHILYTLAQQGNWIVSLSINFFGTSCTFLPPF